MRISNWKNNHTETSELINANDNSPMVINIYNFWGIFWNFFAKLWTVINDIAIVLIATFFDDLAQ